MDELKMILLINDGRKKILTQPIHKELCSQIGIQLALMSRPVYSSSLGFFDYM